MENESRSFNRFSPARKFWMLMLLFSIFFLAGQLLSSLLLIPLLGIEGIKDLSSLVKAGDAQAILALKMVQIINAVMSFIVPAHLFALLTSGSYKTYFGFDRYVPSKIIGIAGLAMLAALPLINWFAQLNGQMDFPEFMQPVEDWMKAAEEQNKTLTEAFLKMDSIADLLLNLLVIAFVAALGEELFFRGALQKTLVEWTGSAHTGIWIAAIIFSAIHLQFYGFLPRMLMGAMLGYMMVWSGSIWVPIAAHFINNGMAVVVNYYVQKGAISPDVENIGSKTEELIFTLISLVIVVFLLWRLRKLRTE